jgi:hypothetical protein
MMRSNAGDAMMRTSWIMLVVIVLLAAVGGTPAPAQVQGRTVKQTFEMYGLLGIFGVDCTRVASKRNLYHVHRVVDENHVQADQMSGPSDQDFAMMIDQIIDIKPNALVVSGTIDARRYRLTLGLDNTRKRTIEMIRDPNETVITDGKRVSNGEELPWHNKCG